MKFSALRVDHSLCLLVKKTAGAPETIQAVAIALGCLLELSEIALFYSTVHFTVCYLNAQFGFSAMTILDINLLS